MILQAVPRSCCLNLVRVDCLSSKHVRASERYPFTTTRMPFPCSAEISSPKNYHRHFRSHTIANPEFSAFLPPSSKYTKLKIFNIKIKMSIFLPDTAIEAYASRMYSLLIYRFQQTGVSDWDICLIIAQRLIQNARNQSHSWSLANKDRRIIAEKIHTSLMCKGPIGTYCGIQSPGTWGIWTECEERHAISQGLMKGAKKVGQHLGKLVAMSFTGFR